MRMPREVDPAMKTFSPANKNVPRLESYEEDLGDAYWENWVRNPYREEKGSFIDHDKLREVAEAMDHPEKEKVEEIATMLEHGADLGIKGEGRWPSVGKNNASVYAYGQRVADSLQTGVKDGILYGPLRREELPWEPKISPMTVRLKPNGSARIIIDLSHPHGPKLGGGEACSPNAGMAEYEEFEPCTMTGDVKWRKCLYRAGRPCEMCKADWDMAYKHVSVRPADHRLQVIEFGGRFFVEKCLTFGGANSPTIYHLPASLLKSMAELKSGLDPRLNCMQLDDNCSCSRKGSSILRCYSKEYRSIASELGIRLAGEDNPSKAFPPSTQGEILGLLYDTERWAWNIPETKLTRLQVLLGKGIWQGSLLNSEAQTLAGKLNHYSNVVGGKYERGGYPHR